MDAWLIKVKPSAATAASSAGAANKPKTPMQKKGKIHAAAAAKKKKVNNAAAKKKAKNSTNLQCPVELLTAHHNGNLDSMLRGLHTNKVKDYCQQCKVPRSGAKYKIISLLISHVERVALMSPSAGAIAYGCDGDSYGKYGEITLEFSSLSFARAHTKFCELDALLKKQTKTKTASSMSSISPSSVAVDAKNRWNTIVAAARGFDFVIYEAITGPQRKRYNGSRGETGIEANDDVGRAVGGALINLCVASAQEHEASMFATTDADDDVHHTIIITEMDIEEGVKFVTSNTKCEPYGFSNYDCNLKEAAEDCKDHFELLSVEHKKKIEDVMAT